MSSVRGRARLKVVLPDGRSREIDPGLLLQAGHFHPRVQDEDDRYRFNVLYEAIKKMWSNTELTEEEENVLDYEIRLQLLGSREISSIDETVEWEIEFLPINKHTYLKYIFKNNWDSFSIRDGEYSYYLEYVVSYDYVSDSEGGEHTEPVYYTKVICRKISGGREWSKWIPYDGLQTVREAISTAQQAVKDDENT